ncbi:MAG: hypothetical protein M1816_000560 [Peltula sp. TS41687]|nr:MAG: hypothetical protein M1816_000560 [Peltula sp. TS41687]
MRLPLQALRLERRENGDGGGGPSRSGGSIAFMVIFAVLATSIAIGLFYATLRGLRYRNASPKYIPTKYLKRKWDEWRPSGIQTGKYHRTPRDGEDLASFRSPSEQVEQTDDDNNTTNNNTSTSTRVDRHTSVRSIATLPAYKPTARDTEQILGREGERGGIDVVIEFPETAEEEENRREEDMEGLYQVRLARRTQAAEREERRRRRREARERGDTATLEALRRESRARAESAASLNRPTGGGGGSSTNLTSGLSLDQVPPAAASRDRRVSSVSYADVGLARHDGSRVRASSDSDQHPLLEGAAPMGNGPSRPSSPFTFATALNHHARGRNSSLHSISTINTSDPLRSSSTQRPPHSRSISATSNLSQVNLANTPETSADDGTDLPPPPDYDQIALSYDNPSQSQPQLYPPQQIAIPQQVEEVREEEAPPYESPISPIRRDLLNNHFSRQAQSSSPQQQQHSQTPNNGNTPPRLPSIRHLPAIEIIPASAVDADDTDRSTPPSALMSPNHDRRGEVAVG